MREQVRVAAAQIAPRFFDKIGTLEKTLHYIRLAGEQGIDLLVFPETYFAAYPFWRGAVSVKRSTELVVEMQKSALRVGDEATRAIEAEARRCGVHCVVGCNELDDRPGSLTLYNTLLFFDRDKGYVGRHRKLMPTHSERVYWGMGDAADIVVFALDIGVVGGLICYEHHMTLLRAAMAQKGEEIHCAVWPGWWAVERHLGDKRPEPRSSRSDLEPAIREYAIENQAFVVSSSWYLPPEAIPAALQAEMRYNLAVGGSCVLNPAGVYLAEPVFEQEALVSATLDAEERRLAKAYFDCVGHYARADLLALQVREEPWPLVAARRLLDGPPAAWQRRLEEIARRYRLSPEQVLDYAEQALAAAAR
ncbi:MAG: nitrilase [Candidatus Tectimicrobiota bacterium]|nr:MAG: nitrilase [Candidatus Tectomicrobia bacterium]